MRKITALFVASTLALGAVNLAHAADSQATDSVKTDSPMRQHKGSHDGGHENMFKGLNLTDTQKQQIKIIMQDRYREMKGSWQEDKRQMHDLVARDSFDKTKAQAQVDKMAEQYKARMLSHLEIQNKIYNILTPEQKKQFNEKIEKRLSDRAERQDKMAHNR